MEHLEVEYLPINELNPYSNNARKHEREDVKAIVNSIREFGFSDPIGVWGDDNTIVEGHGRLAAAKRLRLKEVPVIHLDHLTDEQRRAYGLAHNRTAELSEWDDSMLDIELDSIADIDMEQFGFLDDEPLPNDELEHPEDYIAHFYYDDYKFMSAWRDPNKYIDTLKKFKAVVSPDFSLYIDFPIALQILSCYRRQWCGAYWQHLGLDVIPDVVWGERESFEFCFEGIPKHSTVAVSTVGVKDDKDWNGTLGTLFKDGYDEMMNRLEPTTVLFYGDMIDGLEGNIIRVPSFYEERRKILNAKPNKS